MDLTRRQIDGDLDVWQVREACQLYERDHPGSDAKSYRQNSASVRVRVIDPDFESLDRGDRYRLAWPYFESLPPRVRDQISVFLVLSPGDLPTSPGNVDFEHPIPSDL